MIVNKQQAAKFLGWLQLIISAMLATLIVFGYLTYRAPLGQFIESLAASIVSVSKVVGITAENVEMNSDNMIVNTRQMIVVGRGYIKDLKTAALIQSKQASQYAKTVQDVSEIVMKLAGMTDTVGDVFLKSWVPTVQMEGIRPIPGKRWPMEKEGQSLKEYAQGFKEIEKSLKLVSNNIKNDGENFGVAFAEKCEQTLKLLEDTEKTLDRLQENDLPRALQKMKSTSENLRNISQEVMDIGGNIGIVFLAFGLLLPGWCFLNSLTLLMMANQRSVEATNRNE